MSRKTFKRVLVLGIDGLTPSILERLMDAGKLPAFARLRERGTYRRMETSNPSQSPVAWSSIASGCNPAHHGVFDFIRRNPESYLPELGVMKVNPRNVLGRREAMFMPVRRGPSFWVAASRAKVPVSVIRWPLTLPPDRVNGRMLAGLGVPDLQTNLGRYTFYTTRPVSEQEEAGFRGQYVLLQPGEATWKTSISGPNQARIPMTLTADKRARVVNVRVADVDISLRERQWSDWVQLSFGIRLMKKVRGICRLYLTSLEPHLGLYVTPIQIDPAEPACVISEPDRYAAELAGRIGRYHTLGMPEDSNALTDGCFGIDAFLEQCEQVMAEREAMLWHEIGDWNEGLLAFVFDTSDRIQHVFWSTMDPKHPAYDPRFAAKYSGVIEDYYARMDSILSRLVEGADDDCLVIVLSDHGFTSYRRSVHVNSWLIENGYMALQTEENRKEVSLFKTVDWMRTRAYAVGFSSIYLNMRDREGQGIVRKSEAEDLQVEIAGRLAELRDPVNGQPVLERTYRSQDIYDGPLLSEAPDLVAGFKDGYRASWQTAVGGYPPALLEDNAESWAGDHLVDPSFVPAVFLMNRRASADRVRVVDVAPTILSALGLAPPEQMEGQALPD